MHVPSGVACKDKWMHIQSSLPLSNTRQLIESVKSQSRVVVHLAQGEADRALASWRWRRGRGASESAPVLPLYESHGHARSPRRVGLSGFEEHTSSLLSMPSKATMQRLAALAGTTALLLLVASLLPGRGLARPQQQAVAASRHAAEMRKQGPAAELKLLQVVHRCVALHTHVPLFVV